MIIRAYRDSDYIEIADLFHAAVHSIDPSIYPKKALEAWAPTPPDYLFWKDRLAIKRPLLAEQKGIIVGFVELEPDGHIDCLYVHRNYQGLGIGSFLLEKVISQANRQSLRQLYVEASQIAVPLFKKYGFSLNKVNTHIIRGQLLSNYTMSLLLVSE